MSKAAILMVMIFGMSFGVAQAAEIDDLTMQVVDSNDPADTVNEIELPEVDKNAVEDSQASTDSQDALENESEDSKSQVSSDMETEVEDTQQQMEDSVDSTKDEVESTQENTANEIQDVQSDTSGD